MPSAVILGCEGLALTDWERDFFTELDPWGLILFTRNVESPEQLARLTNSFRVCVGRADAPILIDQEGGRVQRLSEPHWPQYPSARQLGDIADADLEQAKRAVWLMSRLHAFDLSKLGINVNCLPLLDVPQANAHEVIGSRAYGQNVERIVTLGRAACDGLLAGGVLPVVKHIPGHGRANCDSHLALPRVTTARKELEAVDFLPFQKLADQVLGMSAHVVFEAIDAQNPATTSKSVIDEVIREFIGFDGLLMTDDLSMRALSGDFAQRSKACFAAGCDIVLHCNGNRDEMLAIAPEVPVLSGKSLLRSENALNALSAPDDSDETTLRDEFEQLVA